MIANELFIQRNYGDSVQYNFKNLSSSGSRLSRIFENARFLKEFKSTSDILTGAISRNLIHNEVIIVWRKRKLNILKNTLIDIFYVTNIYTRQQTWNVSGLVSGVWILSFLVCIIFGNVAELAERGFFIVHIYHLLCTYFQYQQKHDSVYFENILPTHILP